MSIDNSVCGASFRDRQPLRRHLRGASMAQLLAPTAILFSGRLTIAVKPLYFSALVYAGG